MRKRFCFLWIVLSVILFSEATAQNSQTLYFMNLPQNHLLNPAFRPSNSFYIGFPGLTGVNANLTNNFLNFSDVFLEGQQPSDSVFAVLHSDFDVDKFLGKLGKFNSIEPQAAVQIFGLGFSAGRDFYGYIDITERVDGNLVFPEEFFELIFKGNDSFIGSTVDLSAFGADVKYYRDVSLGFSKNITPRLRIGVQGKLLFGIAAGYVENNSLKVLASADDVHSVEADVALNISGPVKVIGDAEGRLDDIEFDEDRFEDEDEIIKSLTGTKNMGLGLNLGAEYQLTDKIVLSASVIDLGYINWKSDLSRVYTKGTIDFSNYNIEDVYDESITFDEFGEALLDTLQNSMMVSDSPEPFRTVLPFGVTAGGKYNLSDKFSVGLLSYSRIKGQQIKEALTLSANMNLGSVLSTSLSYTACNYSYSNLGAGLAVRLGFFQVYLITDRIPLRWSELVKDGDSTSLPENWNNFHARFGINFTFGNNMKKKHDVPMIVTE